MQFSLSPELQTFRNDVNQFIDQNWQPSEESAGWTDEGESTEAEQVFERELIAKRWHVLAWPEQYGGHGADVLSQMMFNEVMAYRRAPAGGTWCGTHLVGPTLMQFGTPDQLQQHLPGISDGSVVWAQCFSEPNAGSDLASLTTQVVRDGDDYIVNGQKIWTSSGHRADWAIVLGRTNREAPKHRGISYLLIDLKSPGVSAVPIRSMDDGSPFSEIFFEDVRVPVSNRVGEEDRGWYVGATTLDFERSNIGRISSCRRDIHDLVGLVQQRAVRSEVISHGLADLAISAEVGRLLSYRVGAMQAAGLIPNYEASIAKLMGSELHQEIAAFAARVLGTAYQAGKDTQIPLWARRLLGRVPDTIAAGTSEVQRNIIAQRGLGLPR